MASKEPQNEVVQELEPGESPANWPSFESMEDLVSGTDNVRSRRMNIRTLGENYTGSFERYSDPGGYFDIGVFLGGTKSPREPIDLTNLDTDLSLAVIPEPQKDNVDIEPYDEEKVVVGGQTYYVVPMDKDGEGYIANFT